MSALERQSPPRLIVDAARLTYCDGAGAALLLELRRRQSRRRGTCELRSLDPAYQSLLDLYARSEGQRPDPTAPEAPWIERTGRVTVELWTVVVLIAFVGQLCVALGQP